MQHCYEIFRSDRNIDDRRAAVELLRVAADERALGWISEFLEDDDQVIQTWGAGVLDQLLWSELVEPEAAEDLLAQAANHKNESVRERAEFIRGFLHHRQERNRLAQT